MSGDLPIDALKALAHPVRLKLLQALAGKELNVGEIEAVSEVVQPALSQQLAVLRNAGLVKTRKDAKLVFYRVDDAELGRVRDFVASLSTVPSPKEPERRQPSSGAANFARMSAI